MTLKRKLILVTGMPRSGTTNVGDILGTAAHTAALYEPMNFHAGDRVISRYFEIPGTPSFPEDRFDDLVARVAGLRLKLKSGVWPEDHGLRRIAKFAIGGRSRSSFRRARFKPGVDTVIWKDPIAALTVRRLALAHGCRSVITLRSPFAVAASFRRMSWGFDLPEILPRARAAGLEAPEAWDRLPLTDSVINAAVLWSLIYGEQLEVAANRPDLLHVLDLETLIQDPFGKYRQLFDWLELPYGAATEAALQESYGDKRPAGGEVPEGRAHVKNRDISKVNHYWRKLLSDEEIAAVAEITAPVRARFDRFTEVD